MIAIIKINPMTSDNPSSVTLPDMTLAGVIYPAPDIHFIWLTQTEYRLPTKNH
jgi:hypothetical protein